MKKIITVIFLFSSVWLNAQTAKVQIIHNSPDILTESFDLYINNQLVNDSMPFRTATPYMDLQTGTNIIFTVQSSNLPDTTNALFHDTIQFVADSSYILVASGLLSTTVYDSLKPFDLDVLPGRQESSTAGNLEILIHNSGIDAPVLRISDTILSVNFVDGLEYGEYESYQTFTVEDYTLNVYDSTSGTLLGRYLAPFDNMNLEDSAFVILASGFLDTIQGNPGDTATGIFAPMFGLWLALPHGGNLIQLLPLGGIGLMEFFQDPMAVYPVPVEDWLYINNQEYYGHELKFNIHQLSGIKMKDTEIINTGQDRFEIDLNDLPSGIYILTMQDENNIFSQKIYVK